LRSAKPIPLTAQALRAWRGDTQSAGKISGEMIARHTRTSVFARSLSDGQTRRGSKEKRVSRGGRRLLLDWLFGISDLLLFFFCVVAP
jgi:hypothetical protein